MTVEAGFELSMTIVEAVLIFTDGKDVLDIVFP